MSENQYSYIFIAVNDENINEYTADLVWENLPEKTNTLICYIVYSAKSSDKKNIVPINVCSTLEKSKEYKELKRMAFNAHLTWSPEGIADIKEAAHSFANKYNFYSSLENALSIKYKLHSIGIDFTSADLYQKAQEAECILNNKKNRQAFRELVMYEHRRWNVGQIVNSWRTLEPDSYTSLTVSTKLTSKKLHPCLVAGDESIRLSNSKWTENNFKLWDTAKESDLKELDSLDSMSIRLHQHFADLANELKKKRFVLNAKISLLRSMLLDDSRLTNCFELYCYSVNALFEDGANRDTVKIYKYHLNAFTRNIQQKENDNAQATEVTKLKDITKLVEDINDLLFPIIEAKSYTDWKNKDSALIYNIPFILTYSPSIHIGIPMVLPEKKTNSDSLFANVATALVLNPGFVTYIVEGDIVKKSPYVFIETLNYISNMFKKHRLQTKVNITVFEQNGTDGVIDSAELKKSFPLINYIEEIEYDGPDEINVFRKYLTDSLKSRSSSKKFSVIEYNDTKSSGLLQGANYLSKTELDSIQSVPAEKIGYSTLFPFYSYDSRSQKFNTSEDCKYLSYVINKPHLNVEDLFCAKGKQCNVYEPELQSDYMFFWGLYRKNPAVWKDLCAKLKNVCEVQLASIDSNKLSKDVVEEAQFIVPDFCENTLNLVIHEIKCSQLGIISEYLLNYRTSRSLTLVLYNVSNTVVDFFAKLLVNPIAISDSALINIVRMPSGFSVNSYRMNVPALSLSFSNEKKVIASFLKDIADNHYISNLKIDAQSSTASFSFSSVHILRLMIKAGNIFEAFVYYKMLESGQFDDVRNSVVISWNESSASNELDIVATKGFRTIIIECKARNDLDPEFYNKLYPAGDVFGVNNALVLLADIGTTNLSPFNAMQKSRGEELGIATIWKTSTFIEEITKLMNE